MGKNIGKSLIRSFSVIILLMIAIIFISIRGFNMVETQTTCIINNVVPLNKTSSDMLISVLNEEAGIRGYLISGNEKFLKPYYMGKIQIQQGLHYIESNIKNYPSLIKSVSSGKYTLVTIQKFFDNEIELVKEGNLKAAQSNMYIEKDLVENFRLIQNDTNDEIKKYTDKELHRANTTKTNIINILISVSIIVFLMSLAIIAMLLQIISQDLKDGIKLNMSLEKTIKDQEEFYANISHELKTPLNVILSTIQLLDMYNKNKKLLDTESTSRYINIMRQNCFRLSKLSNNLIEMSKIETGYIELHLNNLDIVSAIEDITMSVVEYGKVKGVTLIFDTDVEEKIMAFDHDKIERIMLNLLSNAFKFTNPGDEITVFVKDCGDKVSVSVKDTGIGIPADKLDFIFERFKQVDKSLTRNTEGSGIGLSLVKSLLAMHSGKIHVTSKQDVGSEFVFELPAKIIAEEDNLCEKSLANDSERVKIEFSDIYFHS